MAQQPPAHFEEITYLRHVTRQSYNPHDEDDEQSVKEYYGHFLKARQTPVHPGGEELNKKYDGILYGVNAPDGVFFDTTLYGGLPPTQTAYPTGGSRGKTYWRINVNIAKTGQELQTFRLYKVTDCRTRARAVLLALAAHNDNFFGNAATRNDIKELDKAKNPFMILHGNRWFCPKYGNDDDQDIWVKVFLPFDVDIRRAHWDTVVKKFGV